MKNPFAWAILLVSVVFTIALAIVAFDSRDFVKTFFDVQTHKLNLRTEKSVDSLVNVISLKTLENDSLMKSNQTLENSNKILENNLKAEQKKSKWLESCLAW